MKITKYEGQGDRDSDLLMRIERTWIPGTPLGEVLEAMMWEGRWTGGYWEFGLCVSQAFGVYNRVLGLPVEENKDLAPFAIVLNCQGDGD